LRPYVATPGVAISNNAITKQVSIPIFSMAIIPDGGLALCLVTVPRWVAAMPVSQAVNANLVERFASRALT
jgi:hypothetical protein